VPADLPPAPEVDRIVQDEALRARIRELLGEPKSASLWQRVMRHPLFNVFVGFALTTVAGATITTCYQQRSARLDREAATREARRTTAEGVASKIGLMMNQRLQRMARLHEMLGQARSDSFKSRYESISDEWFEQIPSVAAQVCVYFGPDAARQLGSINRQFSLLRRMGYSKTVAIHDSAVVALGLLRDSIRVFQLRLADGLRSPPEADSADTRLAPCAVLVSEEREREKRDGRDSAFAAKVLRP
jgi:hypothetical protein